MICECNAAIADSAKFCPKCGKSVAEASSGARKCPQCGAENPASAKFCKKDGAPLNPDFLVRPAVTPLPAVRSRTSWALVGGVAALLVVTAGLAFFYFGGSDPMQAINAGPVEKDAGEGKFAGSSETSATPTPQPASQAPPQSEPQSSAKLPPDVSTVPSQGFPESPARAEPSSVPPPEFVGGLANTTPQPFAAEPALQSQPDGTGASGTPPLPYAPPRVAPVQAKPKAPAADKKPSAPKIASVQKELNSVLRQHGFGDVRAKVVDKQTVALSGTVGSDEEKASAGEVASSTSGIKNIRNEVKVVAAADPAPFDSPKPPAPPTEDRNPERVAAAKPAVTPDPAKLEGELNRALREGGVNGVTAQIGEDFSATLRGAARNPAEKEKAFQITRQFPALRAVKDHIFVVEE